MKLHGPDRFALTFNARQFQVLAPGGGSKFRGRASNREAKLYVFSFEGAPIYVGVTKQPMRARLRLGWNARGESGYHGYIANWQAMYCITTKLNAENVPEPFLTHSECLNSPFWCRI